MPAAQRFQAEFGYGVLGPRGQALWVPYIAAEVGDASQAFKLGLKLNAGETLEGAIEIGQRDNSQRALEHVLQLRGSVRW